jgi:hypothetical protein
MPSAGATAAAAAAGEGAADAPAPAAATGLSGPSTVELMQELQNQLSVRRRRAR